MKKGKLKNLRKRIFMGLLLGTAILVPMMPSAYALPSEGTYAGTNASTITAVGSTMNIAGADINNVINWNTFSIATGEKVNFDSNNYLNLVNGINKSTIDGTLNGTGNIYLVNPNGIIFGSGAYVNVGSLIASTRAITDTNITDFEDSKNPITNSTVDSIVGNITNLGNIQANSVVLEGNEVIINASKLKNKVGSSLLTGTDVIIKASDDITVGYKVDNQVDLNKTDDSEENAADYDNATISSSGYTATDLTGNTKSITEAFLVEDIYDLQNMNANLTANYLLANNINASVTRDWSGGFTPVGNAKNTTEEYYTWEKWYGIRYKDWHTLITINAFGGDFNGAGNVITGLTIDKINQDNVGLFGYIESTESTSIKNVGLEDSDIDGNDNVGGLVGYVDGDLEISNSYNTGNISGISNVGGLVGGLECSEFSHGEVVITNSYNTGDVNGSDDNVGGLVGGGVLLSFGEALNFGEVEISNSYNTGNISGADDKIGGLVGVGDTTISNSYNIGSVNANSYVGGLVGHGDTTITNSYNAGDVNGTGKYVGGLVGNGKVDVTNSYNTANVNGNEYVGGLIGHNPKFTVDIFGVSMGKGEISNSYNIGKVTSNDETSVGGLVGDEAKKTNVSDSYYATTNSDGDEINQDSNEVGTGKTYDEMLQDSTYAFSDDIDTIGGQDTTWRMYEGYTTPMLKSFMQTVLINDTSSIYNGLEQTGEVTTLDGTILSSNIEGNIGTNAGIYTIYSDQQGYDLVSSNEIVTLIYTINPKELTVSLDSETMTYGDSDTNLDKLFENNEAGEITGFVNGESFATATTDDEEHANVSLGLVSDGITVGGKTNDVGTYDITSNSISENLKNYSITKDSINVEGINKLTINPKELTVSLDSETMTYGDSDTNLDKLFENNDAGKITGFVNDESFGNAAIDDGESAVVSLGLVSNGIIEDGKTNDVGTYDITVSSISENFKNYIITEESINDAGVDKLSINPKELTVSLANATMTYGDLETTWDNSLESNEGIEITGFVNDESFYNVATDDGEALNIRLGFLSEGVTDEGKTNNVGIYDLTAGTINENLKNYSITEDAINVAGVQRLSITPKELTVVMNDTTMTYGDVNEAWADNSSLETDTFTSTKYSVSGFAYDEASDSTNITNNVGVVVTNNALDTIDGDSVLTENAGTYDVEGLVSLNGLGNYSLASTEASEGTATVDRATLTLTADGINVYTVDDTKIEFTGNIKGFVNGDSQVNPTFNLELLDGENAKEVGEYAINGEIGGVEVGNYSNNYTVIQADGNETAYKVTKASEVVIPDVIDESVQSILDGESKAYEEPLAMVKKTTPTRISSDGMKLEKAPNNEVQINNNGGSLIGTGTITYDQESGSLLIPGLMPSREEGN